MANAKERDEPAVLAHQSYVKKDYATALQHLNELENFVGSNNKRVQHNKAVVEFMSGGMKDIEGFKKPICQITGLTFPDTDMKDIQQYSPFAIYNYAVLLYHTRHYYQCVTLLEKLVTLKNVRDAKLLQQVVLLLMESTLCRRTYDKTLEIAKNHGEPMKSSDVGELFERLTNRAQLMLGHKIKLTLKPDSIENVFIIAQQHFINGDVNEAANTLGLYKTIKYDYNVKTQGEDIWAAINNNLGVIYLSIKKPYLASKYFQHAIKEHFKAMESEDNERLIACRDRAIYVYNLGLSLLATTNIEGAFECLVEAARHYPNNPRIWLHLAECCVKKCCSEDSQQFTVKKLGSGPHTRILFSKENKEKYSMVGESFAIPSLSLEFAALCLRNVITLLPNEDAPPDINVPIMQAPPAPPINWKQCCELKNSAYILQSYILLNLQDPLAALTSATDLLNQTEASNTHKVWAHIYAAEALINLDRIAEAIEHLHPPMIHELVTGLPYQMCDMIALSVWAKAAVCHILRGDLVTARKILLQINSPHVLPLQMYLEICTGNIENCQTILKKIKYSSSSL